MKQNYSYLIVVIISIFSLSSATYAGLSDDNVPKDFNFIMQALNASNYHEALHGRVERDGVKRKVIENFEGNDPLFKMVDEQGDTMLHAALRSLQDVQGTITRLDVIDEMLKKCPDLIGIKNREEMLPLESVFQKKQDTIAAHLLAKYRFPRDEPYGFLIDATSLDLVKAVQCIIEQWKVSIDALIGEVNGKACTLLDYAIFYRSKEVIKYLIGKGARLNTNGHSTLHQVVTTLDDCEDVIDAILERQLDLLNVQDNEFGLTPFMLAVINDRERAIKHLLTKATLDLTRKDKIEYRNVLAWAIYGNKPIALIKSLLDRNPDLLNEQIGKDGRMAFLLHQAVHTVMYMERECFLDSPHSGNNGMAIIDELLRRKSDLLTMQDYQGRTALEYAKVLQERELAKSRTVIATFEKTEQSLANQSSVSDPQSSAQSDEKPQAAAWQSDKILIGALMGIGIVYGIKRMIATKNKPTDELKGGMAFG